MKQILDPIARRWHVRGAVIGTVVTTAWTMHLTLNASNSGGFWETTAMLFLAWSAMFVLFTPALYALLRGWIALGRAYPLVERNLVLRAAGLVLLAIIAAGLTFWCVSLGDIYLRTRSLGQTLRTFPVEMFAFPETFVIFALASLSWCVLPRLLFRNSFTPLVRNSEHAA